MRVSPGLVDAATAVAREMLRFQRPADGVLSAFFRIRPNLGLNDRAFIAETVYALLRRKRLVELAVAETGAPATEIQVCVNVPVGDVVVDL